MMRRNKSLKILHLYLIFSEDMCNWCLKSAFVLLKKYKLNLFYSYLKSRKHNLSKYITINYLSDNENQ